MFYLSLLPYFVSFQAQRMIDCVLLIVRNVFMTTIFDGIFLLSAEWASYHSLSA